METKNVEIKKHKYDYDIDINQKNDARVIAFDFIEPNSRVLDIGSASGQFGQILKKYKNCTMYGIDYDIESIKIAKEKEVFENIYQLDLNSFDIKQFQEHTNSFDYIVFGDVLEHILEPEKVLKAFKTLLKTNGKYIISLPNVAHSSVKVNLLLDNFEYEETGILDKTHIKFFTHKTIPSFMAESKLEIEKFDYTVMHIKHHKSVNNLSLLPISIRKNIFNDKYSHILQYITLCTFSEKPAEDLLKINQMDINKGNMKSLLKWSKKNCMRKYVYLYFLQKIKDFSEKIKYGKN